MYSSLSFLFFILPITTYYNVDRVDYIEINHFYDEYGRLVFDQLIFWSHNPGLSSYRVRDWKLLKNSRIKETDQDKIKAYQDETGFPWVDKWSFEYSPKEDYGGKYLVIDNYKVYYTTIFESWTQYDVELMDREALPKEDRVLIFNKK